MFTWSTNSSSCSSNALAYTEWVRAGTYGLTVGNAPRYILHYRPTSVDRELRLVASPFFETFDFQRSALLLSAPFLLFLAIRRRVVFRNARGESAVLVVAE